MPLMRYFNTEHLDEETRRKIARRLDKSRRYNGEERFEYHRYDIERKIIEAKGDFSAPLDALMNLEEV